MCKLQHMLLVFLLCVFSTTALVQISTNVEIKRINGELITNACLFLSIEQLKIRV